MELRPLAAAEKRHFLHRVREYILTRKPIARTYFFLVWLIADAYFLSYPRSGRTWSRVVLGKALSDVYDLKRSDVDLYKMTLFSKAPNVVNEHPMLSDYPIDDSFPKLKVNKKFRNKKIILLFRDPRDLTVSNFFDYTKRKKRWDGPLSEFIRKPWVLQRVIEFMNLWYYEMKKDPNRFCFVKYEEMKEDPITQFRKILDFLGVKISDEKIVSALEFGTVGNMRKLEQIDYYKNDKMRPANVKDIDSYKSRKGRPYTYKESLSQNDINFINEYIKNNLNKEIGYHEEGTFIPKYPHLI